MKNENEGLEKDLATVKKLLKKDQSDLIVYGWPQTTCFQCVIMLKKRMDGIAIKTNRPPKWGMQ